MTFDQGGGDGRYGGRTHMHVEEKCIQMKIIVHAKAFSSGRRKVMGFCMKPYVSTLKLKSKPENSLEQVTYDLMDFLFGNSQPGPFRLYHDRKRRPSDMMNGFGQLF